MKIELTRRPAVSPIESVTLTLSEAQFRAILEVSNWHETCTAGLSGKILRFANSREEASYALLCLHTGVPFSIKEELKLR